MERLRVIKNDTFFMELGGIQACLHTLARLTCSSISASSSGQAGG